MFHDILVAVDDSPHARLALEHAIDLAESEHARLTLMTAIVQPPPTAYYGAAGEGASALAVDAEAHAQKTLCCARDGVPADVPVTTILTRDPIGTALVRQVAEGHHDLVVMGSRRRGPVRSALLGSVSKHVLRHSPVLRRSHVPRYNRLSNRLRVSTRGSGSDRRRWSARLRRITRSISPASMAPASPAV